MPACSREDGLGLVCVPQRLFASHVSVSQGTITLILATDMARHGEILDSFKQKVDIFDYTDEEHMTCVRTSFLLPVRAQPIRLEALTEMFVCFYST